MVRLKSKKALTASAPAGAPAQGTFIPSNDSASNGSSADASTPRNGHAAHGVINGDSHFSFEIAEKVKELLRLAQEQGYLTHGDIKEILPATATHAQLDDVCLKLRNLEVEIVDQAEVDHINVKQVEVEVEEEKGRLDILDDPVRMYLKQMGQVPLLTREQEVEISKRIEDAENEIKRIIYGFGFAGKEHIALADKLLSEPPKERFDRVVLDNKIEGREKHLLHLRKLVKQTRQLDAEVDEKFAGWRASSSARSEKSLAAFQKLDRKLQAAFPRFFFKHKVIEEMVLVVPPGHKFAARRRIRLAELHHLVVRQGRPLEGIHRGRRRSRVRPEPLFA